MDTEECADCGKTPATNNLIDDPDGGVMWLCEECYEERVEAGYEA